MEQRDVEGIFVYASDLKVCRFTNWGPRTLEQCEQYVEKILQRYARGDAAIVDWSFETLEGSFLGKVSLHHADEDAVRFGMVLQRQHWGKGYATEAAGLAIQLAFENYGFERVLGACDPSNEASKRMLERLGMSFLRHERAFPVRKDAVREMLVYEMRV